MTPAPTDIEAEIQSAAAAFTLNPALVRAICFVESSYNPRAWRHEIAYPYLWDVAARTPYKIPATGSAGLRVPPSGFQGIAPQSSVTEWIGQQSSWGLMQIMGAVARQLGFQAPFPGLAEPAIGLHYGCAHLRSLVDRFGSGGLGAVASAYNGGHPLILSAGTYANQTYVDRVVAAGGAL